MSISELDDHAFESVRFRAQEAPIIRTYGDEFVAWSHHGDRPLHLSPVASVIFEMLDGNATAGEIIDDVHDVVGVPRAIAAKQIRHVIAALAEASLLGPEAPVSPRDQRSNFFPADWNH